MGNQDADGGSVGPHSCQCLTIETVPKSLDLAVPGAILGADNAIAILGADNAIAKPM